MFRSRLFLCFLFLTWFGAGSVCAAEAGPVSYNRDIRPILSDKCFACHGMDSKKRKADLRLDLLEEAVKPLKEGTPLVPGNPYDSLVWQRMVSTDPEEVMPPPDSHKTLNAEEKEILRRWISEGAVYQKHWAFESPMNPVIPDPETRPDLDQLVNARLRAANLAPLPSAERPVLIRRVSFALTGLPPSPGHPNLLRLYLGTPLAAAPGLREKVLVLETHLDDMNPEWYEPLMAGLLAAGALDVALAPIQMKKHRPAVALTVIAPLAAKEGLLARLFADSTTLGVRCLEVERVTARRWFETIETVYGPLQVKVMEYGGRRRLLPEYEACRRMAEAQGVPLIEVYRLVPRE